MLYFTHNLISALSVVVGRRRCRVLASIKSHTESIHVIDVQIKIKEKR